MLLVDVAPTFAGSALNILNHHRTVMAIWPTHMDHLCDIELVAPLANSSAGLFTVVQYGVFVLCTEFCGLMYSIVY